jgi:hypothetical protein
MSTVYQMIHSIYLIELAFNLRESAPTDQDSHEVRDQSYERNRLAKFRPIPLFIHGRIIDPRPKAWVADRVPSVM